MIRTLGAAAPLVDCSYWGNMVASLKAFSNPDDYRAYLYQCNTYGSLPSTGTPTIPAPQTEVQMTTPGAWTPDQATNTGQDWAAATNANIDAAIANGGYNPAGNSPFTATWLDTYKWPLIIGAVGIGGLILIQAVKLR